MKKERIQKTIEKFFDAVNNLDSKKCASFFLPDADIVNSHGTWMRGQKGILEGLSNAFSTVLSQSSHVVVENTIRGITEDTSVARVFIDRKLRSEVVDSGVISGKLIFTFFCVEKDNEIKFAGLSNTEIAFPKVT